MSRPLEARVMSVVGSRGTRDRCPCHVRGRLPRDRRPSTVGRVVLNAPREMPPPQVRVLSVATQLGQRTSTSVADGAAFVNTGLLHA